MKRHWPILVTLILGLIGLQWELSLKVHREEARQLTAQLALLVVPSNSNEFANSSPAKMDHSEMQELRNHAFRVHQLRGEVTLAQDRFNHLAPTITNLATKLDARTNDVAREPMPAFPPGYVPRHELADRGNAAPEAAVETFWWAFTQGRAGRLHSLLLEMANQPPPPDDMVATEMRDMFQRFPGFRITSREVVEGNRLRLGIETGPGGKPFHLMLVATNSQWMVSMTESSRF